MENIVEKYIVENKELLHRQLLDSLKLFEFEKEYAPDGYERYQAYSKGYNQTESINGIIRYYTSKKVYPQITDDEYEKLSTILREKEQQEKREESKRKKMNPEKKYPIEFTVSAKNTYHESFAEQFMTFLAWLLWIGGLIISIMTARVTVSGRYSTETVFQWGIFIPSVIIYFTAGASCMCFAELFKNIQSIASAVCSYSVKEEKK